jgi:hypothetical protein
VPSPAGPAELLTDLATAFADLGVAWYVFGAQAVLLWGRPRMTADVDVTVRLGTIENETLIGTLELRGFSRRYSVPADFVRRTRVLPLVHVASGLAVDIVVAGPGLEDEFLARAVRVTIGSVAIPVISAEDLLVTKVLAGRPKDLDDIRGVLAERGERLALDQVRQTLRLLEAALGQSDLLPVLDAEIARWKARPQ